MKILSFNDKATQAIHGRSGAKLRVDVRDGVLFLRPTDRKAGPHLLAEIKGSKSKGINVEITDKQLDKLAMAKVLSDDATFGMVTGKYGWMGLVESPEADNALTIEGAQVTVSSKDESEEA